MKLLLLHYSNRCFIDILVVAGYAYPHLIHIYIEIINTTLLLKMTYAAVLIKVSCCLICGECSTSFCTSITSTLWTWHIKYSAIIKLLMSKSCQYCNGFETLPLISSYGHPTQQMWTFYFTAVVTISLFSSFFPGLVSAVGDWMATMLPHMT